MLEKMKRDWFSNIRGDVLAGIVVALALIPEAIAFSIIAGVDPMVGLYASFCISVIIAFVGGRSGMISAATGAMALLMVPLVKEHGLQYLLAATILTGIIQLIFGVCKVAKLMKFIPRAVMIGFVNALAILIFMAQVPHFVGISTLTYLFVAITLLIVYVVPRFFKAIPAPLIAIIVLTAASIWGQFDLRTVGDLGKITQSLPTFFIPDIPFTLETLQIIFPYSIALAIVGLLESLLTASIVDDMTGTESNKHRESRGQGIANIVTGFFGGMAGCAMIGQSVINVKSGGRGRLSTLIAGLFLLFLILVLGELVVQIPMPVLVGIMIMVSIGTFDWSSFSYLRKAPKSDAVVMLTTVIIVVATHDLSKGVIAGVILSAIFFVAKISKLEVKRQQTSDKIKYDVTGQLFFASVEGFVNSFDFTIAKKDIVIDFTNAHIWDDSAVGAVDKVVIKFRENNNHVTVVGLNSSSKKIIDKLALYHDTNAQLKAH
ncbi:SulP family inorganic anion transporter [Brevibacillus invocatus]|uniref:SulP family inorganic anion transporter n=2 Tax=Paenibacillaceae TaxID=186822 RepID=A0A3M8CLM8_9BACL|nr:MULTISPECIES: SulP family inorganic anion transporter [Paenibacillaceae]MCM3131117.1 SulP family inorganic anion transporter [Paenibacillus sp. MER 78]MEC2133354.1 SulP family inorganic anion transporter [Brevibacillus centrosporus]RNB76523.1 SulP family inorganic anion transporter [Brevibacillus invocatus]SDX89935.1 sulfate permease, SulP family [Paenibacillus sp. PDC88]SFT00543.1 sulfate permease, SulP family [Paenibacillus sp. 453mf]